jgi:hypothetical protein
MLAGSYSLPVVQPLCHAAESCYAWCSVVQAPGDEPVWRQVLRRHLNHSNTAVAQQAAAALAPESHSGSSFTIDGGGE